MDRLATKLGHGMKRARDESRHVTLDAIGAGEQLLTLNRLSIGQVTTSADPEQRDVSCHSIEIGGREFRHFIGGRSVEPGKDRGRHTHVSVERGSDLVAEPSLAAFAREASETQNTGFWIDDRLNTTGNSICVRVVRISESDDRVFT